MIHYFLSEKSFIFISDSCKKNTSIELETPPSIYDSIDLVYSQSSFLWNFL